MAVDVWPLAYPTCWAAVPCSIGAIIRMVSRLS